MTVPCMWGLLILIGLGGCRAEPEVEAAQAAPSGRLEPAPMPFVHSGRQAGNLTGYDVAVPSRMPAGTGAVPVSSSAVRGTVTTGYKIGF